MFPHPTLSPLLFLILLTLRPTYAVNIQIGISLDTDILPGGCCVIPQNSRRHNTQQQQPEGTG